METRQPIVLVVDDDADVGTVLSALLSQAGLQPRYAASAKEALKVLDAMHVDLVITDLRMPEMDGMQLLAAVKRKWRDLPVVMLTAHGTIPLAVEAMKNGANDFLPKPFDREEVLYTARKAMASAERAALAPPDYELAKGGFVGGGPKMQDVFERIARVAPGAATVLIRGETGTGKECAARAIHEQSGRDQGPFVRVHLGALPETLVESELFGHEKGAFTGAARAKPGRVELADGGTLFLDEIGDISLPIQIKLLRVLQEREFQRIGGTKVMQADVRFVAATHRDLESMVKSGEFREDLLYRLNVVPLWMPPLRERPEDVVRLARHFCTQFGNENHRATLSLDSAAEAFLEAQSWPGNVRQLQNLIERLAVLYDGPVIGVAEVKSEFSSDPHAASGSEAHQANPDPSLDTHRKTAEREAVRMALDRAQNNRTVAARILGISRRSLYNKLDEYDL